MAKREQLARRALEGMAKLDTLTASWRKIAIRRIESGQVESWTKRLDTPVAQR
ncbi:hypothetical protein GCT13_17580 [Paraburkholderia sp. CNPSo 3157]|uniref:Uncharacterized protein n=1 Tax=Paraburkholderia franconis TaxID=2654983 RepID=A0A7X1NBC1_9BURK|nr:hypothetical protein [Paraburkholderia franconis]